MNGPTVLCVEPEAICDDGGQIDYGRVRWIAAAVAVLHRQGERPVVVTAGASEAGARIGTNLKFVARRTREHVLAMLGTPELLNTYRQTLLEENVAVAEAHIARSSFAMKDQYYIVRDSINALVGSGIVPLIANNLLLEPVFEDTPSTIQLAALLAGMLNARKLVIACSSALLEIEDQIGGTRHVRRREAVRLRDIEDMENDGRWRVRYPTEKQWEQLKPALKLVGELGIPVVIAEANKPDSVLAGLDEGGEYLSFSADAPVHFSGVRKWLSTGAVPKGTLIVSDLGADALRRSARGSLLAAGVLRVLGTFDKNEVVSICDEEKRLLGFGVCRYDSASLEEVKGQDSLVVVHADYLYCTSRLPI